ncbi:MAG: hypothetical protein Q8S33_16565 [Myxococcales bacterium]|nr:hypothetical protein [Myxococcales bacterium]MDP3501952.1 hypothetical protein [Myxococcales bacterium]
MSGDLDTLTDELLAAAKSEAPSAAVKERVLTAVLDHRPGGGARPLSRWMRWVGGLSLLTLGLFGWLARGAGTTTPVALAEIDAREFRPSPPLLPPPVPDATPVAPTPSADPPALVESAVVPTPQPANEPSPRKRAPTKAPPPDEEDALARELALLDVARMEVPSAPTRALATLQEHARRFPKGALGTEADLLRVEALVKAGRRAEAVRLGQRLTAQGATGPLAERVQRLLEGIGP